MATESQIDKRFTEGFNEANDHYRDDRLEECVAKARELLNDPAIPRYYRMRTLVLLGSTLGEWGEANDCRLEAEAMWRIVRRWHPLGEDVEVDRLMAIIRESLDDLDRALREEDLLDSHYEDEEQEAVDSVDDEFANAGESMEGLHMDEGTYIPTKASAEESDNQETETETEQKLESE
ncbi:hypothetical protein P153DRAFT_363735 [Dothidotthia symphoricarpi CBS 119687]|uniref:Uncharacterized protein n=1 Tax=Dothidotthia symphoricarpi CBS 119687 TaxID=1392245 RepID=A0A6A6ARE8_9PLEO|nr:uncharacterized protein P153DRAFT_363735 [Dothidotthia symphoricarpi CBS 119687]KAF2133565.1 hypothetical protein P153DRAFT_363735 [Dothidotthia symphoricarpi CBS 119687]